MRDEFDHILLHYLDQEAPVDTVTKTECDKTHAKLDKDVEGAIEKATAAVEFRIKIWILVGALVVLFTVIFGFIQIGMYRERIDSQAKQMDRMEQSLDRLLQTHIREQPPGKEGGP